MYYLDVDGSHQAIQGNRLGSDDPTRARLGRGGYPWLSASRLQTIFRARLFLAKSSMRFVSTGPWALTHQFMSRAAEQELAAYEGRQGSRFWNLLLAPNGAFILRPIRMLETLSYFFPPADFLHRRYGEQLSLPERDISSSRCCRCCASAGIRSTSAWNDMSGSGARGKALRSSTNWKLIFERNITAAPNSICVWSASRCLIFPGWTGKCRRFCLPLLDGACADPGRFRRSCKR